MNDSLTNLNEIDDREKLINNLELFKKQDKEIKDELRITSTFIAILNNIYSLKIAVKSNGNKKNEDGYDYNFIELYAHDFYNENPNLLKLRRELMDDIIDNIKLYENMLKALLKARNEKLKEILDGDFPI